MHSCTTLIPCICLSHLLPAVYSAIRNPGLQNDFRGLRRKDDDAFIRLICPVSSWFASCCSPRSSSIVIFRSFVTCRMVFRSLLTLSHLMLVLTNLLSKRGTMVETSLNVCIKVPSNTPSPRVVARTPCHLVNTRPAISESLTFLPQLTLWAFVALLYVRNPVRTLTIMTR